jgi:hypothetical protein
MRPWFSNSNEIFARGAVGARPGVVNNKMICDVLARALRPGIPQSEIDRNAIS